MARDPTLPAAFSTVSVSMGRDKTESLSGHTDMEQRSTLLLWLGFARGKSNSRLTGGIVPSHALFPCAPMRLVKNQYGMLCWSNSFRKRNVSC